MGSEYTIQFAALGSGVFAALKMGLPKPAQSSDGFTIPLPCGATCLKCTLNFRPNFLQNQLGCQYNFKIFYCQRMFTIPKTSRSHSSHNHEPTFSLAGLCLAAGHARANMYDVVLPKYSTACKSGCLAWSDASAKTRNRHCTRMRTSLFPRETYN